MALPLTSLIGRALRRQRAFVRNERGATLIEFGLLAVPRAELERALAFERGGCRTGSLDLRALRVDRLLVGVLVRGERGVGRGGDEDRGELHAANEEADEDAEHGRVPRSEPRGRVH